VVGVIDNFKAKGEFTKNEPAFFQLMWPRSEEGKIVLKLKSGTDANFEAKLVKDLGSMLVGWTVEVSYLTDQRQNQHNLGLGTNDCIYNYCRFFVAQCRYGTFRNTKSKYCQTP
jgi:putative ABC transport system permease protein